MRNPHWSKLSAVVFLCLWVLGLAAARADDSPTTSAGKGTIAGNSGRFATSIPLQVPAGRHGFGPKLALSYNSANGNGMLGIGWDLSQDYVSLNFKRGENLDCNPGISPFPCFTAVLGGSVSDLILEPDWCAYCYGAQIEGGFVRFRYVNSMPGIIYWEATDKSGTTYTFGQTSESQSWMRKWMLTSVTDTHGNTITYHYIQDKGEIYPDRIDYHNYSILFKYDKYWRNDKITRHEAYTSVTTRYRLDTIDMLYNGTRVRAYKLQYSYDMTTRLLKVQQYGRDAVVDGDGMVTGGSTLPAIDLSWSIPSTDFAEEPSPTSIAPSDDTNAYQWLEDVTGDGRADFIYNRSGHLWVMKSVFGDTFAPVEDWGARAASIWDPQFTYLVDINNDGKRDFVYLTPPSNAQTTVRVLLSTGASFLPDSQSWGTIPASVNTWLIDMDRNGATDLVYTTYNSVVIMYSNGDSFRSGQSFLFTTSTIYYLTVRNFYVADVTGDGFPDVVGDYESSITSDGQPVPLCTYTFSLFVMVNTGSGLRSSTKWLTDYAATHVKRLNGASYSCTAGDSKPFAKFFADVNGDGKSDVLSDRWYDYYSSFTWYESTGAGFVTPISADTPLTWETSGEITLDYEPTGGWLRFVDINADGLTDIVYYRGSARELRAKLSVGNTFESNDTILGTQSSNGVLRWIADSTGDGRPEVLYIASGSKNLYRLSPAGSSAILLTGFSNGLGGGTRIDYAPSSVFWSLSDTGWNLPFVLPVVVAITACPQMPCQTTTDGQSTSFIYRSGYYNAAYREFRGFSYIKVTDQQSRVSTETYYFQGNGDVDMTPDNPLDWPGSMQGQPYRTVVNDANGVKRSGQDLTYWNDADGLAPYFRPLKQEINDTCDESPCRETKSVYYYDDRPHTVYDGKGYEGTYGVVVVEQQYGDTSTVKDDKTIVRSYKVASTAPILPYPYYPDNWILLPHEELVYKGISSGAAGLLPEIGRTGYYYDNGVTDCSSAGIDIGSQIPLKGDLSYTVRSNAIGGVGFVGKFAYMGYDTNGNILCVKDGNGNVTKTVYDSSGLAPRTVTNPLNQATTTEYYGLNGVAADKGLPGQVKTVTDANNAVTTTEYDGFGRKVKVTVPAGAVATTGYNLFGTPSSQNVQTMVTTSATSTLTTWTYFDGFGRPTFKKSTAAGGKVIATKTEYLTGGQVWRTSLPYFDGTETPSKWQTNSYDAMNRIKQVDYPDGTSTLICYGNGVTVTIDAKKHRKRETKDAFGRLIKVEEYLGTYNTCVPDVLTPYATTQYEYDVLGNLVAVTDAKSNKTTMSYDWLGRKLALSDSDTGNCGDLTQMTPRFTFPWYDKPCWNYEYDNNGNLITQMDAKGQVIRFEYDALNRVKTKRILPSMGPDLTLTQVQPNAASASSGGSLSVTVIVKNIGASQPSGYYGIGYVLSSSTTLGGLDDIVLPMTYYTAGPASGLSTPPLTVDVPIPAGIAGGNYYLCARVDVNKNVDETNESNNVLCSSTFITVQGLPGSPPRNFKATVVTYKQVLLTWEAATAPAGLKGYVIERCVYEFCSNFSRLTTPNSPQGFETSWTSYSDATVTETFSYTYRVRAVDLAGNLGPISVPVSVTLPASPLRPKIGWWRLYNGPANGDDATEGKRKIALDAAGNVYVTGWSWGGLTLEIATLKYDKLGTLQWAKRYDTGNTMPTMEMVSQPLQLVVDSSGNVYVTTMACTDAACNQYDIATIKYNTAGAQQWVARYNNGGNDFPFGLAVDGTGNVYVTGSSQSASGMDAVTIKYGPNGGNPLWVSRYHYLGREEGATIVVDLSGNVYIGGGSCADAACTNGNWDMIAIKYDSTGAQLWAARYDNGNHDYAVGVVVDGTGNLFVTGHSCKTPTLTYCRDSDYVTVKYGPNGGTPLWVTRYDNGGDDYPGQPVLDGMGNVYVTGSSWNGIDYDYATIKYTTNGVQVWAARYDTGMTDRAGTLMVDPDGNVYVSGYSYSDLTPGPTVPRPLKYSQGGTLLWAQTALFYGAVTSLTIDNAGMIYLVGGLYNGSNYDYITAQLTDTAPAPPANLNARAVGVARVALDWLSSPDAVGSGDYYEIQRSTDNVTYVTVGTTANTTFTDDPVTGFTTFIYRVRAIVSGTPSKFTNYDLATTVMFTDDPILSPTTTVREAHINELRQAINAVRLVAGLPLVVWPEEITPCTIACVTVKAAHVQELRIRLQEAFQAPLFQYLPPPSYTVPTIMQGAVITKSDLEQIRNAVK